MNKVAVGLLVALVWLPGKAGAAQCGGTSAGFEAWKRQFAGEAQARGVSASAIAAVLATNYSNATIAADRGQRSFSLSLDQFLAKRGAAVAVPAASSRPLPRIAPRPRAGPSALRGVRLG
jgi:membrane-bound lytic murein transglycosylase B